MEGISKVTVEFMEGVPLMMNHKGCSIYLNDNKYVVFQNDGRGFIWCKESELLYRIEDGKFITLLKEIGALDEH